MKSYKVKAILTLVFMTAIWGGTFPLIKSLLNQMSANELLTLRFFFASLVAFPFILRKNKTSKKQLLKLFLLGISLWIAYEAQTVGLKFTTPTKSAFITGLYIIFTPLLAIILTKEKIPKRLVFSLLMGISGLYIISNISFGNLASLNVGDLITLISALAFAVQIILTNQLAKDVKISYITSVQMLIMFILSFAASGFRINIHLSIWTIIALIFLGSIGGYLAILAETYSLKYIDPSRASIIFTLEPIFALIFSVIFIKEQITLRSMIGAMLIFISIVLASTNGAKDSG